MSVCINYQYYQWSGWTFWDIFHIIPCRELALSPVKPFGVARPPSRYVILRERNCFGCKTIELAAYCQIRLISPRIPQPVMAKPIPALRNLKTAQMVKVCTKFTGFLDCNLQAVSSPVADYVKNNPVPHLVRCFISTVMNKSTLR